MKGDLTNYWIEKYSINHIDEIDNIDKMKLKNFKNLKTTDFDDIIGFEREGYDAMILKTLVLYQREILNMILVI